MKLRTKEEIDNWFTHHPPNREQVQKYVRLRAAAKTYALVLADECPESIELETALLRVRESVMLANAAIACHIPEHHERQYPGAS